MQEDDRAKATEAAKKEAAHLEVHRSDNRFKELQKEYDGKYGSKPFTY